MVVFSSWRPRHRPPADDMRVRVIDRLPGLTARIKDNAVTGLRDALSERDFVGLRSYFGQQRCVCGGQACQVRIVRLGNDQHMNWGLRIDVAKCKGAFCFKHTFSRDLASHDSAE
jgi:hypothetical protein